MPGGLNVGVEILKLARLVGCEPQELAYLELLEPQDVRDLREQVTGVLFDADRHMLQRVAAASKLLPSKLAATIGESVFGPLLCARLTGVLDPHRAVDIASRLSTPFLADVSQDLDPRRASRVIGELPASQVADIAKELVRRRQYITMGNVVGHLSKAATLAALGVIDNEALLRTAYVVESKGSLASLVALIGEERMRTIIRTAADADLWAEALDVMGHVSERQRGELADIAAAQDDEVLETLVAAAGRDGLWGSLLRITRAMSSVSRERFVALPSIQTEAVLAAIVQAAADDALWADLLVFLPLLPPDGRRHVAVLAADLDEEFAAIIDAAHREELWPALITFAAELDEHTQARIAALIAASDASILTGLMAAVEDAELERESLAVIARLAPEEQGPFAERVAALASDRGLTALVEAAKAAKLDALHAGLQTVSVGSGAGAKATS
ncbi:MAG TPA: hypothetical protein VGH24_00695 [Solirubrobacteraceae bacterium]